jgi:histidyl-tRNA synthetase
MNFRTPEGTQDILPEQVARWRRLEDAARECFARYG